MNIFIVMLHDCKCGRSHIINVFDNLNAAKNCMIQVRQTCQPSESIRIHTQTLRNEFNVIA